MCRAGISKLGGALAAPPRLDGVHHRIDSFRVSRRERSELVEESRGPVVLPGEIAFQGLHDDLIPAQAELSCPALNGSQEAVREVDAGGHKYIYNIFVTMAVPQALLRSSLVIVITSEKPSENGERWPPSEVFVASISPLNWGTNPNLQFAAVAYYNRDHVNQ